MGSDFRYGLDGFFHMIPGVERAESDSDCSADSVGSKLLMGQWRTMQAGPAGDVVLAVQNSTGIGGLKTFNIKA